MTSLCDVGRIGDDGEVVMTSAELVRTGGLGMSGEGIGIELL